MNGRFFSTAFRGNGFKYGLSWLARFLLAAVFVYAALPKLNDPAGFSESIRNYQLLPYNLSGIAAVCLPVLELVVAIALFVPTYCRAAALLALGMLFMFSAAIASTMWRGIDIDCGCFGSVATDTAANWISLARNISLMLLAGVVLWFAPRLDPNKASGKD